MCDRPLLLGEVEHRPILAREAERPDVLAVQLVETECGTQCGRIEAWSPRSSTSAATASLNALVAFGLLRLSTAYIRRNVPVRA
jgi:hypothetical protein